MKQAVMIEQSDLQLLRRGEALTIGTHSVVLASELRSSSDVTRKPLAKAERRAHKLTCKKKGCDAVGPYTKKQFARHLRDTHGVKYGRRAKRRP